MNYMIMLVAVVVCIGIAAYNFIPTWPFFIVGLFGVIIGVGPTLIIIYLMAPRMFYYRFRLYEDRENGTYVEKDVRARKIKGKDNYEYFETPDGQRFRATDIKHFVSGFKGQIFGDLFRSAGSGKESQVHPIKFDLSNKNEIRKKTIPVEQRAWFSNERIIGSIKEVTKIPIDTKMQAVQVMGVIGVVMMLTVVMIFGPTWYEETTEIQKQNAAEKVAAWNQVLERIDRSQPIMCKYEVEVPQQTEVTVPEPPPQ